MKKILLILAGLSLFSWAEFTKNDDIVTDSVAKLMWQDDSDASHNYTTWQGAIDYCEALVLGAYSDWRLPNINELYSIVDDNNRTYPSIYTVFTNTYHSSSPIYYWSATNYADYDNSATNNGAWIINFSNGSTQGNVKSNAGYTRCVRDF